MQFRTPHSAQSFGKFIVSTLTRAILGAGVAVAVLGCGAKPLPPIPPKLYPDVSLTILCPDAQLAEEMIFRAAAWSTRTGGRLKIVRATPHTTSVDGEIVLASELSSRAARAELLPVPGVVRSSDHPAQWDGLMDVYKGKLCSWGPVPYGVPILGEGSVLVYRQDLFAKPEHRRAFREQTGSLLEMPRTYPEISRVAAYFTQALQKPALPPWPQDDARLLLMFHQVAACYDRRQAQLTELSGEEGGALLQAALRFHVDPLTGESRLLKPQFLAALGWLASTREFRPREAGSTVDALASGSAVLAVMPLADLSKLPRGPQGGLDQRFAVGPMPGSNGYYDDAGRFVEGNSGRNYVPFLGSATRVGVVYKSAAVPEAVWDFYAELLNPLAQSTWLAQPKLGSGPLRGEHTTEGQDRHWESYGLDAEQTRNLALALREFAPYTSVNPALALRTPDQTERMDILGQHVRRAVEGKTTLEDALRAVQQAWAELDARAGSERSIWFRKAVALD